MNLRLIATAAFGVEAVVERELHELGYTDTAVENGKVTFSTDESGICRANLWLRCADRVLVQMGVFCATTFDELFEQCKALPWADWISRDGRFPVTGRSVKSRLHSVPDCQAIVKKAIVESLKSRYHLEQFPETGALYPVNVSIVKDKATITIDTTGPGLHKRGYRKRAGSAPLKETLAAAIVRLSRWHAGRPLLDPFCGSGTIPVEAALIGCNMAPGATRSFAAETWPVIPTNAWRAAREEAADLARLGEIIDVAGSDIDGRVIELAREHARLARVGDKIRFERRAVKDIKPSGDYGCIICNPPYGERLGSPRAVEQVYREMRLAFLPLDTWSIFVLTAHKQFEKFFGRRADKRRRLFNGQIECTLYQFFGPLPPRRGGELAGAGHHRELIRQQEEDFVQQVSNEKRSDLIHSIQREG